MSDEDVWSENDLEERVALQELPVKGNPCPTVVDIPKEVQTLNARALTVTGVLIVGGLFWWIPLLTFMYHTLEAFFLSGIWHYI